MLSPNTIHERLFHIESDYLTDAINFDLKLLLLLSNKDAWACLKKFQKIQQNFSQHCLNIISKELMEAKC